MRHRRVIATAAGLALVAAGPLVFSSPAQASTLFVWSGDGDGESWGDPDNWTPRGVPDQASEGARVDGATVWVSGTYDLESIELSNSSTILNDGGALKATTFSMDGGRLDVPITTGSAIFTGPEEKEISNGGAINATLVRGGQTGTIAIRGGTLVINSEGTPLLASTSITVGARVDGRGATLPKVEVKDTGCTTTTTPVCGLLVDDAYDSYGSSLDGVTLVSSNVVLLSNTHLSLRGGVWRPRNAAVVRTANGSFGRIDTGPAYAPGDVDSPEQDVALPDQLTLDNVGWQHVSGTILGGAVRSTLTPGAKGGSLRWMGGTIEGQIIAHKVDDTRMIDVQFDSPVGEPLRVQAPPGGRGGVTLEGVGRLTTGTTLELDGASTLTAKSPFTQLGGSTITTSSPGSSVTKVTTSSAWSVGVATTGSDPAVIESVPFIAGNWTNVRAGATLRLDGGSESSLKGLVTYLDSATSFGRVEVGAGSTVALSDVLTAQMNPGGTVESGDEMLIVESLADEGEPSGITGGFSTVRAKNLPPGVGVSGELIDVGYVLAVGMAEELALTGSAASRVRIKKAFPVTYTILNKSAGPVTPQLNLPALKGAKLSVPTGMACTNEGATTSCELTELSPGASATVSISYTFRKPGKQTITSTVTSAGYNPNPAGARSTITVSVTR